MYVEGIERMDVIYNNITVRVKRGQVILDDVSGVMTSGRLTAIMGPSGLYIYHLLYNIQYNQSILMGI
jgi:Fe-S cluster assembly ATPase SufC